jgi:hypothetical protein
MGFGGDNFDRLIRFIGYAALPIASPEDAASPLRKLKPVDQVVAVNSSCVRGGTALRRVRLPSRLALVQAQSVDISIRPHSELRLVELSARLSPALVH